MKKTFIECTSHKQLNSTSSSNFLLKGFTLGLQVAGVAVQYMGVLGFDVNVLKEVIPHVGVIALGMLSGQT